jgi:hypothetical protein
MGFSFQVSPGLCAQLSAPRTNKGGGFVTSPEKIPSACQLVRL